MRSRQELLSSSGLRAGIGPSPPGCACDGVSAGCAESFAMNFPSDGSGKVAKPWADGGSVCPGTAQAPVDAAAPASASRRSRVRLSRIGIVATRADTLAILFGRA